MIGTGRERVAKVGERSSGIFRRDAMRCDLEIPHETWNAPPADAPSERREARGLELHDGVRAALGVAGIAGFLLAGAAFLTGRMAPAGYVALSAIAAVLVVVASTLDSKPLRRASSPNVRVIACEPAA